MPSKYIILLLLAVLSAGQRRSKQIGASECGRTDPFNACLALRRNLGSTCTILQRADNNEHFPYTL